jgi:acetolactate decarboxylase
VLNPPRLFLFLALSACASVDPSPAPGTVRAWGSLREALRDGDTRARVKLSALDGQHLFAVGAVKDLDGEITIVDGVCHASHVRDGRIRTERSSQVEATILFAARVPRWKTIAVTEDVAPAGFDAFIARHARNLGIDIAEPFPFLVEGELTQVDVHVLAGECPIRARMLGSEMKSPPLRKTYERVRGLLVGIHASHGTGTITHHGSATHVHAVLADGEGLTGHCDAVGIAAGAVLRLPSSSR